jgi:hypothetical protein
MDESEHRLKYYRKPWMSDGQWACALLVADVMGGFHHCHEIREYGAGVATSFYGGNLATFDSDRLTRLVFLAHDRCVRVEMAASSPGRVRVALHHRGGRREGAIHERHPTLEQALEMHRRYYPPGAPPAPDADARLAEENAG